MKAILEFDMSDPDDAERHRQYMLSPEVFCELEDLKNEVRAWSKYGHTFKTANEVLEAVRKLLVDFPE